MANDELRTKLEFIKKLPKTDLHCHIDGSIRPETILELAKKDGIEVPTNDKKEIREFVQVIKPCKCLVEYLEKFELPGKVFDKPENIKRVTLELIEDASKQGIRYIELRFAPLLGSNKYPTNKKIEATLEAIKEGKEKFNVDAGIILCAMRHEPCEKTIEVIELANKYKKKGVVAVDLAGNEKDFPPIIHRKAFKIAKKYGIKITIHAGETGEPHNIYDAVKKLGADRIGHGFTLINNKRLLNYFVAKQIPLELCVKSNIDTGGVKSLRKHPIKKLFDKGVKVTVNTDDMTVSNVNIMDEYKNLLLLGFKMKDIFKVIKNGIEVSFAPQKVKDKLIKELNSKQKDYKKIQVLKLHNKNKSHENIKLFNI